MEQHKVDGPREEGGIILSLTTVIVASNFHYIGSGLLYHFVIYMCVLVDDFLLVMISFGFWLCYVL